MGKKYILLCILKEAEEVEHFNKPNGQTNEQWDPTILAHILLISGEHKFQNVSYESTF